MTQKPNIQRLGSYTMLHREGMILLCRLSGGPSHNRWTLPGGGVEFGEHPDRAAVRETLEETGLHIRLGALRQITDSVEEHEDVIYHHVQLFYEAEITGGELTAEIDGSTDLARWFTKEEAESVPQSWIVATALRLLFES